MRRRPLPALEKGDYRYGNHYYHTADNLGAGEHRAEDYQGENHRGEGQHVFEGGHQSGAQTTHRINVTELAYYYAHDGGGYCYQDTHRCNGNRCVGNSLVDECRRYFNNKSGKEQPRQQGEQVVFGVQRLNIDDVKCPYYCRCNHCQKTQKAYLHGASGHKKIYPQNGGQNADNLQRSNLVSEKYPVPYHSKNRNSGKNNCGE